MSTITADQVRERLSSVKYPGFSRDIISFGLIKEIKIDGPDVTVQMSLATNDAKVPQAIKTHSEEALRSIAGIGQSRVLIDIQAPAQPAAGAGATDIPGVKHIIAVGSGKGGVGKSTVAANLAVALQQTKARVGLCDCDMYGPSVSMMFGARDRPMATEDNRIVPVERYDLKLMSMGFLLEDDSPAILRGPMVTRYTQQFLRQVEWGELDYLILDLPPGTGDIQLTIVQTVALAGAVIVTTPQEVALIDARKAAAMFQRVNVPVLGIIENMSYFLSSGDDTAELPLLKRLTAAIVNKPRQTQRHHIFGTGGGEREAKRLGVPLLGQIPIDIATCESGDRGRPIASASKNNPVTFEFEKVAAQLRRAVPV